MMLLLLLRPITPFYMAILLLVLFIRDNFILRRTLLICAKLVSGQPMPLKLLRT